MSVTFWALIIWLAILVLSVIHVLRHRHESERPVAAAAIFVTAFTAAGVVLFFVLGWLIEILGIADMLTTVIGGIVFLALVFVPAWLVARWQALKPRKPAPPID
ncbi:MAG: hypothetical protein RLO50_08490 [Azospirillaceae bacterium]